MRGQRLLFLCKRRPMGRDLFDRPYGRFFYLPKLLADRGCGVAVALLSYRRDPTIDCRRDGVHWISESVLPLGPVRYLATLRRHIEAERPDWIIGLSDTYYGILAWRLARKYGTRCVIDAYDNYESYIPWLRPLHRLWRRALAETDLVSAAGPHLAELMGRDRGRRPTIVVPMAADPIFRALDREDCRRQLSLPQDRPLVGYCGALYAKRGVDVLFRAFEEIRARRPDALLVLSGRKDRRTHLPSDALWLGHVPDDRVPLVINSLNVLVVTNRATAFGNYSYPVKLYEAMRCGIPVIATRTQAAEWILRGNDLLLASPGDSTDVADKALAVLPLRNIEYDGQPDWELSCTAFENGLLTEH
jgi:glycosyltransferase involved in cell wall biosynthesis